jgi:hypothetical protein
LSDDENSSSSSSDEEQADQVNNFRNSKSQRTNSDVNNMAGGDAVASVPATAATTANDMQMEFTNSTDFKASENWADFSNLTNQVRAHVGMRCCYSH